MTTTERRSPVRVGEPAPEFVLPAVNREGTISLSDYRGRTPVLLAMMRGLYLCILPAPHRPARRNAPEAAGARS